MDIFKKLIEETNNMEKIIQDIDDINIPIQTDIQTINSNIAFLFIECKSIEEDVWMDYLYEYVHGSIFSCENCGFPWAIPHSSRTSYNWDGKCLNPNRDINLCPYCAEQHHEYWDEMWSDYWRSKF